ncbi:ribosomal protein S12 methylthiotransferase RimO [Kosmotoga arenicorallina S304]|uniref:Ribosomal protein uS12 methylthiotransferase RimO n=1 Tax=Kosmotoga arenicorallina S304 TaxID=1453497 RepID=A0A182C7I8_9BACT|nr:30S ribosomal protein S12 methylthiotransferase RimO [Kosmotoga arenicorallina]OAA31237.1 ribosomal protein S12 methylthiotransferase RimO [Kosmotoga arenicorallina S304]
MNIGVLTLGCPKNVADMENFKGIMKRRGHQIVSNALMADAIIIDTCGFIGEAKRESVEEILNFCSLKEENPSLKVIAIGCLVQRYFNELKEEIPELDGLIGVTPPDTLADLLEREEIFYLKQPTGVYDFSGRESGNTYAYVKIGDGCDRNCAFCSIPSFKGRSQSRKMEDIVSEVQALVSGGVKEIILVSQDNTQYGKDLYGKQALPDLLRKLDDIKEDFWVRVMYLHPDHLNEEIIDSIALSRNTVKYFDIPVQSGSNSVLKAMGRSKNREELIELFRKVRSKMPDAVLRTTIMVGFPGETSKTFAETLDFIKEVKFNKLGGFVYSPEEGTPAYSERVTISREKAQELLEELLDEQDRISYELNQQFLNKKLKVLIEDETEELSIGRSWHFSPEIDGNIYVRGKSKSGELIETVITQVYENDMEGFIIDEHT